MEGLFDYAVLWQAGSHNLTCPLGNHLNAHQFQQLCDGHRTVSRRLWAEGITVLRVALPEGHDPDS